MRMAIFAAFAVLGLSLAAASLTPVRAADGTVQDNSHEGTNS
jgi:hypothetical protein